MKRCNYILFSLFLSAMIVFLSVGVPFVQYSCMKCADVEANAYLPGIVKGGDDACSCNSTKHKDCSCCGDHSKGNQSEESNGCSKVNIVKINLPILTSSIHLDDAVYPVIDLSIYNYLSDLSQLHQGDAKEQQAIDDSGPLLRPREYINCICTLII